MGKLPIGVPKASEHCNSSSCANLNPIKANLVRLIFCPEKSANSSSKVDKFLASSTEPSMKNFCCFLYANF